MAQFGPDHIQKQPLELFSKKCVLKNFALLTGKKPVLESLFDKVAVLQPIDFIKETPTQVFSCEYCEILKSIYFEKHLQTTASTLVIFSQENNNVVLICLNCTRIA